MIWQIIRHPLRALGMLIFLAALEGAFGSPTGASRLLQGIGVMLTALLAMAGLCVVVLAIYGATMLWR